MIVEKEGVLLQIEIRISGKVVEIVSSTEGLDVCSIEDGRPQKVMKMRVDEELKTFGLMKKMFRAKSVSLSVKGKLYVRVVVPTLNYAAETRRV